MVGKGWLEKGCWKGVVDRGVVNRRVVGEGWLERGGWRGVVGEGWLERGGR